MKTRMFTYGVSGVGVLMTLFLMVFFLFTPYCSRAAAITDNMLGYWKFDNNLSDSSGDNNMGALSASFPPTYSTVIPTTTFSNAKSLYFPSKESYMEVTDVSGVSPGGQITFSMWVFLEAMPEVGGENQFIGGNYDVGTNTQGFNFSLNETSVSFNIGNGSASFPISNIAVGSWFHLAGTWDGTNMKIYLNGTEMHSTTYTTAASYTGTSFRLGNFIGKMDDVRLYNKALNSAKIVELKDGKHISLNWDGSFNTDYANIENWDLGMIPDPYAIINIPMLLTSRYLPKLSQFRE